MPARCIPYGTTGSFSAFLLDYLAQKPELQAFYHRFPTLEAFAEQLQEKQAAYSPEARQRLVDTLKRQYAGLADVPAPVAANIDLLAKDTTFTITTGHQLNLFTGPLYFVYKIATALKLCRQLKEAYPQYDFVPLYWMASEDHDFAEINHFHLFGKRHEWQAEGVGGPVGRLPLAGLAEQVLSQLPADLPAGFREAYEQSTTLGEATRRLTTALFGQYGLVSLEPDDAELKKALVPVLTQELQSQPAYHAVQQANAQLEAAGYKPQVYTRPLNLFYLAADSRRERLEMEGGHVVVRNTDLRWTTAEAIAQAEAQPENFSPNVVLRPLYQELVLPNLCYIGGGAEVAYWFQLKGVFDHYHVPMPLVLLRNSALYVGRTHTGKLRKLGLTVDELFRPLPELKKQVAATLGQEDVSLAEQQQQLAAAFAQVTELAQRLDPTLVKTVAAEQQKISGIVSGLEKRLSKAAEAKHETAYSQLTGLKDKLFPDGGLQERTDNVLSILINNPAFIDQLIEAFDPLALQFTIIEEE
ncbi:bacillithiol biosynthesis cysteine-adding enzyme BshC [Hymenobacter busanensis]|uniref:Putative cysteine ligase BshC n=1 Tax=Hymenobacter busanensis TaxID=2607656 RepID=A0A7L4ZXA0_9BACT|nr:bacillithiol biosynthesis cysteine-adding enzyme BshC [Hymenobacter busanensis]KAA9333184.1 bacillithiol biosynthesis cysteine-adding enzyme BshC [Hymenobacter busanensis]QHJ08139.1 bacillithiol biosynthesis cysteine-adding enzyme BshC [Hymenobacter busanensis]